MYAERGARWPPRSATTAANRIRAAIDGFAAQIPDGATVTSIMESLPGDVTRITNANSMVRLRIGSQRAFIQITAEGQLVILLVQDITKRGDAYKTRKMQRR